VSGTGCVAASHRRRKQGELLAARPVGTAGKTLAVAVTATCGEASTPARFPHLAGEGKITWVLAGDAGSTSPLAFASRRAPGRRQRPQGLIPCGTPAGQRGRQVRRPHREGPRAWSRARRQKHGRVGHDKWPDLSVESGKVHDELKLPQARSLASIGVRRQARRHRTTRAGGGLSWRCGRRRQTRKKVWHLERKARGSWGLVRAVLAQIGTDLRSERTNVRSPTVFDSW